MKKFLAICMAWILCLGLAGCGRGETAPAESAVPPVQPQQTVPDNPLARQVIYEDKGIRITVKGMEEDNMTGTEIRILVENGTDRNIAFSADLFVVNGITVPGYLYAQAAAGTKTNDSIELYTDVLIGRADSAALRRTLLTQLQLPTYLSAKHLPQVLGGCVSREQYRQQLHIARENLKKENKSS
jgi:hypothetical protein